MTVMPGAALLYPAMTFMVSPPVTAILMMTTAVVPAIVRLNDEACRLGRHAYGGNTADCDHRSDQ